MLNVSDVNGALEVDQVNVEAIHCHTHSSSSQSDRVGGRSASKASSPRLAIS